jgi:hypothetical protein
MHSTLRKSAAWVFVAAALAAIGPPSAKAATVIYSETSDNGGTPNTGLLFRDNPQTDDGDANAIDLDNVIGPGLFIGSSLEVTQVQFQLRRRDGSPATTLSAFYSTITGDRTSGSDPTFSTPPASFGSANLSAIASNGTNTPTTSSEVATIGNGTDVLFTLSPTDINYTDPLKAGTTGGEFLIGFKLDDSTLDPRDNVNFQGVQLAKPDTGFFNPDEVFTFIPPNSQSTFTFFTAGDANDGAGLYMKITGNIIAPEPGTLSLAALGGLLLLARRPSRTETSAPQASALQ